MTNLNRHSRHNSLCPCNSIMSEYDPVYQTLCFSNTSCQGASETGDVLCPSTHRALTYLWNGHSRGQIPAGCLGRNEKKAVFSFCLSPAIYNGWATQGKELNKERVVTRYCQ